jgi:hypothetical protein
MRILALLCLLVGSMVAQQPAPAPPVLQAPPGSANTGQEAQTNQQKARAILDRTIAALGGENYLTLQDSFTEGRYGRFHNDVMVGGTVFFRYWRWPDQERFELTKARDIVNLYLGDKVYEVTYKGGQLLDPQKDDNVRLALTRRRYALDRILREWINAPGVLLLDEGQTISQNRLVDRVTIINTQNESVSLLISADTHLPVEKRFTIRDPNTRDRDEESEIFDNWRMVQGVATPYSTVVIHNGQIVRQQYLSDASYNLQVPDSYFTPVLINHERDARKK